MNSRGHSITIDHDSARFLAQSPAILKVLAEAHSIKTQAVRSAVLYVLSEGLINANDTMHDGYGAMEQKDYPEPKDFWTSMFYGSAGSLACERNVPPHAQRWLFKRKIG